MSIQLTRLLSDEEYKNMQEESLAKGWWRNDPRMFTPGMGWYEPWYFDPTGERERKHQHVTIKLADRGRLGFLSVHYWRDWSHIRPPLCVVCPNGELWEIDRKSNNGDGWKVEGEFPNLVVSPSIVVDGYHGFLGTGGASPGWFTQDIEGRGPHGTPRPITERTVS